MKKFGILLLTLIATPLIAGLYGAVHDQLSYTISPEYFTKFKYNQFGLEPVWFGGDRQTVAVIGMMATWWTGVFIGLGHGLTGLIHKDAQTMLRYIVKGTLFTLAIAVIMGLVGLVYGKLYVSKTEVDWWFPADLIDKENFIVVGMFHNFSYLGGAIGLILGILYQIAQKVEKKPRSYSSVG